MIQTKLRGMGVALITPFNEDGSVDIPKVLWPYMGGTEKLVPKNRKAL